MTFDIHMALLPNGSWLARVSARVADWPEQTFENPSLRSVPDALAWLDAKISNAACNPPQGGDPA